MKLSDFQSFGKCIRDVDFDFISPCLGNPPGTFLTFLEDEKYLDKITLNKNIRAVICDESKSNFFTSLDIDIGVLISPTPRVTFFLIQNNLAKNTKREKKEPIIGKEAHIEKNAVIGKNVIIGENVYVGNNVVIHSDTIIGDNVVLRDGCIIGSSGFEVKRIGDGMLPIIHSGKTIIQDNVELKEYVTVHKAVFEWDETIIKTSSQVDSKAHISHGTKINERVLIGAGAIILGNVIICNDTSIGAGSIISNRIIISEKSKVTIGSVVTKNTKKEEKVSGNFAIEHSIFLKKIKKSVEDNND
ncbi:hypothetical protein [Vagococcus fluvialis]|uniref:hypothetical protein n=1 Tax=Vagococcus fluvialis TaxID=2738 RepID=UPI002B2F3DB0|nr:hypothetical protein QDW48_03785 [Vagococcus fluvialis]